MASDTDIPIPFTFLERKNEQLFDRQQWRTELLKMVDPEDKDDQASDIGKLLGERQHPFNMPAAIKFKDQNEHHSTCVETYARALTGHGFEEETVEETLDPLCDNTFQEILNQDAEDFKQTGNAYMEVVWKDKKIVGLHYVPAPTVTVVVENKTGNKHYRVCGEGGMDDKLCAGFGELELFKLRMLDGQFRGVAMGFGTPSDRSEILHIPRMTTKSRWYGYPDWLSAVSSIELIQCMLQERYDFFQNRGVPEMMLFFFGKQLDKQTWGKVTAAMQSTIGLGNQHKSLALNITDSEMKVQLEKLAMESGGGGGQEFSDTATTLALAVVTAHRTPPVLAHIQIPGKMGATNELPNALMSYQAMVIGPEQKTFSSVLANTLGNPKRNGGLGLVKKDFKLKTILELIPLGMGQQEPGDGSAGGIKAMDTMSRMRTPAASANGRDLGAGVKK